MKVNELFEAYRPKIIPTHLKSGKPNPNHPHYEKHKAEYDAKHKKVKVEKIKVKMQDWIEAAKTPEEREARFTGREKPPANITLVREKPKKEPKERIPRFGSDKPKNDLEKKAQDAMQDVWQAIAYDIEDAVGQIENPYSIAEWCTDANRLQLNGGLSAEEEKEILKLPTKTLARLCSKFGY